MTTTAHTPITITRLLRAEYGWWEPAWRAAPDDFAHIVQAVKSLPPARRRSAARLRQAVEAAVILAHSLLVQPGLVHVAEARLLVVAGTAVEEAAQRPWPPRVSTPSAWHVRRPRHRLILLYNRLPEPMCEQLLSGEVPGGQDEED